MPGLQIAKRNTLTAFLLSLFSAGIYCYLSYYSSRDDIIPFFTGIALLILLWWLIYDQAKVYANTALYARLAVFARLAILFAIPDLSDDIYRYIWDGQMVLNGVSPYLMSPADAVAQGIMADSPLFELLNSRNYISVYPPIPQIYFTLASWVGQGSIAISIISYRLLIWLTEVLNIYLINKLIRRKALRKELLLLYAWNPLIILEFAGNGHTEAIMISFLLMSLLALYNGKSFFGGVSLGLAISTKIIPVLLIPAVIVSLSIRKSLKFIAGTALTGVLALGILLFQPEILDSLRLYFQYFEFNGSIYELVKNIGYWIFGYNIIHDSGPVLALVGLGIISVISLNNRMKGKNGIPGKWLLIFTVYYLFSTTVHPWYIAVLPMLGIFTCRIFPFVWSILILLSYALYLPDAPRNMILFLEYGILAFVMFWDFLSRNSPISQKFGMKQLMARAKLKWDKIKKHLHDDVQILEIGCGNGALTHLIHENGKKVMALDVLDKSKIPGIIPLIYDGHEMPFESSRFDTAILSTVLHHCENPESVLAEAIRCSNKVIIIEEVYESKVQKWLTMLVDSVVNLEFAGHPHENRSHEEWLNLFDSLNCEVIHESTYPFLRFFRQGLYVVQCKTRT